MGGEGVRDGAETRRRDDTRIDVLVRDMAEMRAWRRQVDKTLQTSTRELAENTRDTKAIAKDTARIRGLIEAGDRGVKVLCTAATVWRFVVRYLFLPVAGVAIVLRAYAVDPVAVLKLAADIFLH